jgi:signal transduction histidine kinase
MKELFRLPFPLFSFKRSTLRNKFFLLVLLLVLLTSLLMSGLFSWSIRHVISEENQRGGKTVANLFGSTVLNYLKMYNFQSIQQQALIAKKENQLIFIVVYTKEGVIAAHTEEAALMNNRATGLEELTALQSDLALFNNLYYRSKNEGESLRVFDVFVPIISGDPPFRWGTVRVGLSSISLENELLKVNIRILEIGIFCLLTGWCGATFLSYKIIQPIERIVEGSKKAASGDLTHQIEIKTGDELEYLADNYNNMINQLRNQQEEKIRTERMAAVGLMANTIIHDCRTPIAVIKGYSSLIVEFKLPEEKTTECLNRIIVEIERMENMLDELLQYSTERKVPMKMEQRGVDEFIRECLDEITALFHNTSIVLLNDLQCNQLIYIDSDKLRRAILNIVVNAKDAMKGKGIFKIKTFMSESKAEIHLSDDAGGMAESIKEHLFDPFFTHSKQSGFGLGMAITKRIIDDHDAEILVQCEKDVGTTFILKFPPFLSL